VILSFDGNAVEDTRELVRRVGNTAVGATVPVTVFRNGEMTTLQVTLGRRETAEAVPASAPANDPVPQEMLGIEVTGLTDDLRAQLDLPEGAEGLVVTEIDEASDAFEKGLRRGDLITEAGQERVADASDLADAIEAARDAGRTSLLLLIERAGEPRFMALPLGG
jgi:serine protease Do